MEEEQPRWPPLTPEGIELRLRALEELTTSQDGLINDLTLKLEDQVKTLKTQKKIIKDLTKEVEDNKMSITFTMHRSEHDGRQMSELEESIQKLNIDLHIMRRNMEEVIQDQRRSLKILDDATENEKKKKKKGKKEAKEKEMEISSPTRVKHWLHADLEEDLTAKELLRMLNGRLQSSQQTMRPRTDPEPGPSVGWSEERRMSEPQTGATFRRSERTPPLPPRPRARVRNSAMTPPLPLVEGRSSPRYTDGSCESD